MKTDLDMDEKTREQLISSDAQLIKTRIVSIHLDP